MCAHVLGWLGSCVYLAFFRMILSFLEFNRLDWPSQGAPGVCLSVFRGLSNKNSAHHLAFTYGFWVLNYAYKESTLTSEPSSIPDKFSSTFPFTSQFRRLRHLPLWICAMCESAWLLLLYCKLLVHLDRCENRFRAVTSFSDVRPIPSVLASSFPILMTECWNRCMWSLSWFKWECLQKCHYLNPWSQLMVSFEEVQ